MYDVNENAKTGFERTEFDASINPCCWVISCPFVHCGFCPISTTLILDAEEATRIDKAICGSRISVRPYGELGVVEKNTFCCFVCFDSSLGTIMTGWGCDNDKADMFVSCMKERINDRGDGAHAILSDQILEKSIAVNQKIDQLMAHIGMNPLKLEMEDRGGG